MGLKAETITNLQDDDHVVLRISTQLNQIAEDLRVVKANRRVDLKDAHVKNNLQVRAEENDRKVERVVHDDLLTERTIDHPSQLPKDDR